MKPYLTQKSKLSIFKKISLIFLFLLSLNTESISSEKIIINGNQNISKKTIYSFLPNQFKISDVNSINNFQKKLFDTGFFQKIELKIVNNELIINLVENPLINFFYIDGIKKKELKNKLFDIIQIRENTIFQSYIIKEDIKNISDFLYQMGYLNNKIDYQLIKIKNNQVNIFYNIELNENYKIKRVYFIGEKFFKSSTLKDVIYSSEHGWWKFLSSSTTPSDNQVNADISRLKNFYLNNGFLDIQINSSSIKLIDKNYANITYSINSGQQYFIDEVNLIDNSNFLKKLDIDFLNKNFKKLSKEIYSSHEVKKVLNLISDYLVNSNYQLIVNYDFKKISSNKVKLIYSVFDDKDKKIVDKITVTGNNITDEFVIRNSIKFSEGDVFNQDKLNLSIERLKGKGLFKDVLVEKIPKDNNNIEIKIKVVEEPTGEISAGAGAGTDGVSISGGIKEKNFLGRGLLLNSSVTLGSQNILANINYIDPDFYNSGNTFKTHFFIENNDFDTASYENKLIGISTSLQYEFYDKFFLNPGIAFDYDSLTTNSDASYLVKKREGDFFTSKLFYNISKNTKNRDFQPSSGYVFGFGQGYSILSDIPYIDNNLFGSYYNEFIENFVGSIKYKIQSINGFDDDIKFSDRLFVTSSNLRGFASRGIGPKIDNDYIGGNYSFYTSASSTIPNGLPEKWNAITNLFVDTANVWGVDDNSADSSNKIRISAGFGLSWISPLGPISLTYAEPLSKENSDKVEKFNFKIGSAF